MRDIFFFPLAAAAASTFIFVALNPLAERLPSGPVSGGGRNAQDVTIQGEELSRFVGGTTNGLTITLMRPEGGKPFLRIDRQAAATYDDPRKGPHLILAEDLENALASRPVEVTVMARFVGDFPASQFEADYFATIDYQSGWQPFTLTREFAPHTLTFFTPRRGREEGYDYVGLRPVTPDKHRIFDIQSVRIRAAGPKGTPPIRPNNGIVP